MSITKGHTRLIPCSLHSDCKNVQKSALKSVNVQRTGKSILQMFAFSFFEGSHICRFLPILRPSTVPRSHFSYPKTKAFTLIISHLYLQIVTSASESRFCVGKWYETTLYQFVITCTYFKFVILSVWWWLCDKRARRTCFGRVPRRWCESHRLQKLLACPL